MNAADASVLELSSDSPERTEAWGRLLGGLLRPGDFLGLRGELGAGKTTFVRGLAAGLGVPERASSPSYLLCHEYPGPVPFLHLDAYFEARLAGVLAEGLIERFAGAVVVAEWAERMAAWLPADRLDLALAGRGRRRRLRFTATGPVAAVRLRSFQALLEAPRAAAAPPAPPASLNHDPPGPLGNG